MEKVGDLEIDQDIEFQENAWTFERIGWIVMALIILFGALGLFGTGPLSSATAGDPDGPISLSYQRFVRHDGQDTLSVKVAPDQVNPDGTVEIWISAAYLEGIEFQGISPEPEEVRTDGVRTIYTFSVDDPVVPVGFMFFVQPQSMGRYTGEVGIVDGPVVSFRQFSYP